MYARGDGYTLAQGPHVRPGESQCVHVDLYLIEKAYYGELSHSEIAAQTGLPLGTIKSRIRLALDRLRHAIG